MALAHLGLVDEQDHGLPLRRQPRQNLPPIGRHHRVADHMRVGQKPLDPLVAAVQPLGRARQARRHIHQVGAAHLKHRRHQQRQLTPLRLTLARQALLAVRRDGLGQLLDPTHSRRSAHPGALNHTPSLFATKLTHDKPLSPWSRRAPAPSPASHATPASTPSHPLPVSLEPTRKGTSPQGFACSLTRRWPPTTPQPDPNSPSKWAWGPGAEKGRNQNPRNRLPRREDGARRPPDAIRAQNPALYGVSKLSHFEPTMGQPD